MGINMLSAEAPLSPLAHVLRSLSYRQLIRLCGNGMQLSVECAWMSFCLGHMAAADNHLCKRIIARASACEYDDNEDDGDDNDDAGCNERKFLPQ